MRWLSGLNKAKLQHGEEIALENCDIPVKFHRHPRARRLSLRINPTDRSAIITAPPYCSDKETLKFLESNITWLHQQFANIPAAIPFQHGHTIPIRGRPHKIHFAGQTRGQGVVWITNQELSDPTTEPTLNVNGTAPFAPRRLKNWLIKQARQDLTDRSLWHANNLGLKFKKITIKDQRSRWGSCSSAGVLSYSWRLILCPTNVLDYVAAHEVAHLKEMNHGPNFWALVHKTMPNYETPKAWLRENGTDLHRYGAAG